MKDFVSSFVSSLANTPPAKRNVSSHIVARIFLLLMTFMGFSLQLRSETILFNEDFSTWTTYKYETPQTINDVYLFVKSGKSISITKDGLSFDQQNGTTTGKGFHGLAIPLNSVNKELTITMNVPYSSKSTWKYAYSDNSSNVEDGPTSISTSEKDKDGIVTISIKDLKTTLGVLYIGEAGSNYTTIKSITIVTLDNDNNGNEGGDPTTYTITYDLNGGEGVKPTETPKAANTIFTLASADGITKADNVFKGWNDDGDGQLYSAGTPYTMPARPVTFTASWEPSTSGGDTPTELVSISEQTTWNFAGAASEDVVPTSNEWIVLSDASKNWNENFAANSLAGQGSTSEYFYRSNNNCYQAAQLKFRTDVPGSVSVDFSDTGSSGTRNPRHLFVNDTDTKISSNNTTIVTAEWGVDAGEVIISSMIEDGNGNPSSSSTVRIYKVTFTPSTGGDEPTYTITYDLNGGEGVTPTETRKVANTIFTLASADGITKTDNVFKGWNDDGDNQLYSAGAEYIMPARNVTFTASWELSTGGDPDIDPTPTGDEKYYYFAADVDTDGTLKKDATNTVKFLKADAQGKLSNISNDEVSMTAAMSSASWYYYSNSLNDVDLSNSANWKSSSATGRYIRGLKMSSGTNYTLNLGNRIATSIKFYGYSGGTSKTLTIGDVSCGETFATKNQFGVYEFTKQGDFTGNVTISQDGDFYGILVITCGNTRTPDPDEPTLYTVTFDYNGGTGSIQSLKQESENASITLPAPDEREGYDFLGWFTAAENEDFVGQAYGTYQPKTDITLYAHWQQTGGSEEHDPAESCFDMTVKASAYGTDIPSGTIDITEYFDTNSGGILSFSSGGRTIKSGEGLYFNSNNDALTCTLPDGKLLSNASKIKLIIYNENSADRGFQISETGEQQTTNTRNTLIELYFTGNENLNGQNSFTIKRVGGAIFLYSIVVEGCADKAPTISIFSSPTQIGCDGVVELSLQVYDAQKEDITDIQWSLNGNVIPGANADTYQATVAGTYSVEVTFADGTLANASFTLTAESVIETLVPKLTYQFAAMRGTENNEDGAIDNNKNRPYTSDDKYPLFSVAPAANGKNQWTATVEIHKKDKNGEVCYTSTTYPWIEEYEIAEDNTITLVANYAALRDYIINESLWQILEGDALASDCDTHILRTGDTIMVKVEVEDCPFSERQVPIVISDKYSLAYIIRGNVDGDFYNDLYAPDTNDNFYQTLSERYEVTQVNAYAPFRKLNYAPFDIVVLSDYPKATGSDTDADLMNRRYPTQMGALAQLVDYKPIFSLKGFLSALSQWKELGLMGNPRAPKTVTEMTVLCEHRVLGTSGSETDTGDRKIKMLSGGADNKGLQGFLVEGLQNFIPIAVIDTINDNGQTVEGALIACCERQIKTEARMIILSIYSGAMDKLTDDGENAIYEIVDYLLDARPAKVEDCAYIFNGGPEGNNTSWKDPQNWATGSVPQSYNTIRIEAPCEIDDNIEAVSVRINNTNGSLTIAPNGALKVTDKFYMYDGADNYDKLLSVTDPDLITVKADATGNGMLIHTHNDAHPLYATVQLYSAAHYESGYTSESTATKYWTYFGVPVKEVKIPENFLYAYTYLWSESESWIRKADGTALYPFYGYALSQDKAKTFELKGQLASTDSVAIKLTKTSSEQGGQDGMNLVGNSWTAPIHIQQMTDADFGDAEKTIYIYQTGRDPENGPTVSDKSSDGCWLAIPVDASAVIAPEADEYDIPTVIPAMQAFEINTPKNTELHLVYDRIVRNQPTEQYNNAPRRVAANRNNPLLMRIRVEDSNTAATLYLLEDDSFTEGFDNGWDGRYMGNDGRTAGLWAYSAEGDMSVMAQPKIDGTTLGFKAGRENYYTFSFKWNGSPLWLNDIMLQRSVAIEQGSTYTFRASDTDPANRFCISSEPYSGGTETSLSDIVLTDGVLSVNNPTGEKLTLSVYDATGRLCSRTVSTDHLLTTDIADVCQGVYMISVEGENTNIVKKVIR